MKKIDLDKIEKFYSKNYLSDEIPYIQITKKIEIWKNMDDHEKLEYRIKKLKYAEFYFEEDPTLLLDKLGIDFIKRLIVLIEKIEIIEFESLNDNFGILFRIKNLFYISKFVTIF